MKHSYLKKAMTLSVILLSTIAHTVYSQTYSEQIYKNKNTTLTLKTNGEFILLRDSGVTEIDGNYTIDDDILNLNIKNAYTKPYRIQFNEGNKKNRLIIKLNDEEGNEIPNTQYSIIKNEKIVANGRANSKSQIKIRKVKKGTLVIDGLGLQTAKIDLELIETNNFTVTMTMIRFIENIDTLRYRIMENKIVSIGDYTETLEKQ